MMKKASEVPEASEAFFYFCYVNYKREKQKRFWFYRSALVFLLH